MISQVEVPPLDPALVRNLDVASDRAEILRRLAELCGVAVPSKDG